MSVSRQQVVQLAGLLYELRDKMEAFAPIAIKARQENWGIWKRKDYNSRVDEINGIADKISRITSPKLGQTTYSDPYFEVARSLQAAYESTWDLLDAIVEGNEDRRNVQKRIHDFFGPPIGQAEKMLG